MASKAAKLTAKKKQRKAKRVKVIMAGRPRKEGMLRTASGRISRSQDSRTHITEQEANQNRSVAVEARSRHHGVSKKKAADPLYGYSLGRLMANGLITEAQYKAGNQFADDMARYYGLTGIPFPSAKAQNMYSIKAHIGDDSKERSKAARVATDKFMQLHGLLKSSGGNGVQVYSTVNNVCVLDADTVNWPSHMLNMLRKGLKVLSVHYGITG